MPDRAARAARAGRPRRRPRWGLRLATMVSAAVLAASGAGHALVHSMEGNVQRVDPFGTLDDRPEAGRGLNILLVGTDSRENLTEAEQAEYQLGGEACDCADSIMLLHLSEDGDRAGVVSLPRDSYAELPAHTVEGTGERHEAHPDKLNAALAHGGPALMVRTVEDLTGVRVDHYVEVNFAGFMRAVDEVGGVEVCTVDHLRDERSGLDLPPGTSTLNGGESLAYVRARHLDGDSDFGRMERQQRFLAAFLDRVISSGVLLNPGRLGATTDALLGSVRTDHGFGAEQMLEVGHAMRDLSSSAAEFASVPVADVAHQVPEAPEVGATVAWEREAAERLFAAVREDRPLTGHGAGDGAGGAADADRPVPVEVAPEDVRVQVENATERRGLARRVDAALAENGFVTTGAPRTAAPETPARTTISHTPEQHGAAVALRAAVPGAELRQVAGAAGEAGETGAAGAAGQGETLLLTLGEDYERVQRVRAAGRPMSSAEWETDGYGAATAAEITCD